MGGGRGREREGEGALKQVSKQIKPEFLIVICALKEKSRGM